MELVKFTSFKRPGPSKACGGPGGINCPCCRVSNKRKTKAISARALRRASKVAVHVHSHGEV
jgi:hypothetical protein